MASAPPEQDSAADALRESATLPPDQGQPRAEADRAAVMPVSVGSKKAKRRWFRRAPGPPKQADESWQVALVRGTLELVVPVGMVALGGVLGLVVTEYAGADMFVLGVGGGLVASWMWAGPLQCKIMELFE